MYTFHLALCICFWIEWWLMVIEDDCEILGSFGDHDLIYVAIPWFLYWFFDFCRDFWIFVLIPRFPTDFWESENPSKNLEIQPKMLKSLQKSLNQHKNQVMITKWAQNRTILINQSKNKCKGLIRNFVHHVDFSVTVSHHLGGLSLI